MYIKQTKKKIIIQIRLCDSATTTYVRLTTTYVD